MRTNPKIFQQPSKKRGLGRWAGDWEAGRQGKEIETYQKENNSSL
jgi:hypothetical protein